MRDSVKVTVCQLGNSREALDTQWGNLCDHVRRQESRFVLLPEMAFAPWFAASRRVDSSVWDHAESSHQEWLLRLPELGASCVAGTRPATRGGGGRRNEAFVWTPETGVIPAHDKYFLPDEEGFWEATWYDRGEGGFEVFDAGEFRIGFVICTEMWFMDRARAYGKEGIHMLLVPRATPHASVDKWLAGGRAAGVIAGAYCLSSNRVDDPGGADLGGLGWVTDPEGVVLGVTSEEHPWITVEISRSLADEAKKTFPRYVKE